MLATVPIAVAGLVAGVLTEVAMTGGSDEPRWVSDMSEDERREVMHIRTLPSGETLGHAPLPENARYEDGDLPDFIGAIATNGKLGYVRKDDLEEPLPASPEEAVEITLQQLEDGPRSVPVYADDGETVIGEFLVGGGMAVGEMEDGSTVEQDYDKGTITTESPDGTRTVENVRDGTITTESPDGTKTVEDRRE